MKTSPSLAGSPLFALSLVLASSMLAGCRTDTLRAQTIYLVDDEGRSRLVMHGGHGTQGPLIAFRDENAEEGDETTGLSLALTKTGSKGEGPTVAFIEGHSAERGWFLTARPDGAHLEMGGDDSDWFGITSDKDGLVVSLEPKGSRDADSGVLSAAKNPIPKEARGVRITLDHGRIVVHDLAGHELGALADPSAPPK